MTSTIPGNATATTIPPSPTQTSGDGSASSSPLLFFVALGFVSPYYSVIYTDLVGCVIH